VTDDRGINASGNTFGSLGEEFHISGSTLLTFDKKFWKWVRKEYWSTWVGGVTGVGFDDIDSIEKEEKLFRQMGLFGFITCMDRSAFCVGACPLPSPVSVHWQRRLPHHRRESPLHNHRLDQVFYNNFHGRHQRQNHCAQ
jgi:hypothetical protein